MFLLLLLRKEREKEKKKDGCFPHEPNQSLARTSSSNYPTDVDENSWGACELSCDRKIAIIQTTTQFETKPLVKKKKKVEKKAVFSFFPLLLPRLSLTQSPGC